MKYLKHFRPKSPNGEILATGGITIVMEIVGTDVKVGYARCNTSDNFCKKTGRELANTRFDEAPLVFASAPIISSLAKALSPELVSEAGVTKLVSTFTLKDIGIPILFVAVKDAVLAVPR